MSDQREQRAKEIIEAIRKVLYRDWDPLDICDVGRENEYDAYISRIYRLLVTRPTREAVAHELKTIQVGIIGNDYSKERHLLSVADLLLGIDMRLD